MIKNWISAARPRTLFLAVASVILGTGLAWHEGMFYGRTFLFTLLLAVSIQILSNLANDLGDYEKGTDITGKRQGPARAMQSGNITRKQMKTAIAVMIIFSVISGLMAVFLSLGIGAEAFVMLAIGVLCILSALFYTMGKHAYGYKGWGDFFAFFFFGPVPVIGTYFLHTGSLDIQPVLPAIGLGLISAMALNINNMRDIDNDRASGKKTLAVRLGLKNAKFYHTLLTFTMFACFIAYNRFFEPSPWYRYAYVLVFLLPFKILIEIHAKKQRALDPYLKFTALTGFLLAIFFSVCINM